MKVLIINGSPRMNGNTTMAIDEMIKVFDKEGVETEVIRVGNQDIRGCIACGYCYEHHQCVFNDLVNETASKFEEADGLVIATPVYFASANPTLIAFLDRLFYSTSFDKSMKVGAGVAVARRGGLSSTYDELNKFFGISNMPIATSCYWNSVHGRLPGEASEDLEGLNVMRTLASNMSFLMKAIRDAKEKYGLPEKGEPVLTNFVR